MPAWRNISLWMDQLDDPLQARPMLEHDLDVNVLLSAPVTPGYGLRTT